ncbi:XRE family transcriptional regulator [Cohnella endophytica]|uniref:XRE family transcriptional regulator n=1 Tax=Cohnella endophytica TaxID=2419778 RepID=A0A494Y6P6_9BACL|nr:helix-turn-helix transcriptional regulator [Cohnella endophytica]RKP56263.1 XRE family transcriptional regulator [Cohnella endophytica]
MTKVQRLVGARIREIRKQKGWSQEALAEHAGFHYSFIGSVERGQRNISLTNLEKLASTLGVEVHQLFAYSKAMPEGDDKDPLFQEIIDMLIRLDRSDLKRLKVVIKEFLR